MAVFGKLQIKHKVLLAAVALVLGVWSAAGLVLLPQRDRLAAVRDECRREAQAVRAIEAFTLRHPDVEAYLAELDRKSEFLGRMLPDTTSLADYSGQLATAAKQSGVVLARLEPVRFADKGDYQEIQLEVSLRGSQFQLLHFLKLIEDGPRFSVVTRAALPVAQGAGDSRLDIRIFSLRR